MQTKINSITVLKNNICLLEPNQKIDYINELNYKRDEYSKYKQEFKTFFEGGWASGGGTHLIQGTSGSGKTTTIRKALYDVIIENPQYSKDYTYIDGGTYKTPSIFLKRIMLSFGKYKSYRDIPEILEDINSTLNLINRPFLIIIDDIDKIYKNSRDIPRYLFLMALVRMQTTKPLKIILLTNNMRFLRDLHTEISSSITHTYFNDYSPQDFKEILMLRAKYVLTEEAYTEDDIVQIALAAYNDSLGDSQPNIRNALNILKIATERAHKEGTPISHKIKNAMVQATNENYVNLIRSYHKNVAILFFTLAYMKKKYSDIQKIGIDDVTEIKMSNISKTYNRYMKENYNKKLTDRQILNYLDQLSKENMIMRAGKGKYLFCENPDKVIEAFKKSNYYKWNIEEKEEVDMNGENG